MDGYDNTTDHQERQAPIDRELVYQGPSLYPLSGDDVLMVTSAGSAAGVTVGISLRTLNQAGQVKRQFFTVTPTSNRAVQTNTFPVGDGFLLDITARITTGTALVGQVWIVCELVQGLSGEQKKVTTLAAGYVTPNAPLFGPASNYVTSVDTFGAVRSIQVSNPPAGSDFSQTVPTGARWVLNALFATLATSATVATRLPRFIVDDGVNTLLEIPAAASEAASLAVGYSLAAGAGGPIISDAPFQLWPIPNDLFMTAGFRIRSSTAALQAGDGWINISLLIREVIEL